MQSSSENHIEEITILEKQRAIFERLYQCQQQISSSPNRNLVQFNSLISEQTVEFSQFQNFPIKIDKRMDEKSRKSNTFGREQRDWAGSDFTRRELARQSFSTFSNSSITRISSKKRKAEFYEEDECKVKKHEGEAWEVKSEITVKSEKVKNSKENLEVKKADFIHVRARRGQATDSHSLAERARRLKISKKMKCLQDLVPGCSKVIGKAGMLDEIINYVQSLQEQVEFLSIKLATSSLNTDRFHNPPCLQNNLVQQQQGDNIDVTQMLPQRRENFIMSFPEAFLDSSNVPLISSYITYQK